MYFVSSVTQLILQQLTEEQRERMERNRKLAIEKRLARLQQQQQQQEEEETEESSGQQEMTSSQEMDYFGNTVYLFFCHVHYDLDFAITESESRRE